MVDRASASQELPPDFVKDFEAAIRGSKISTDGVLEGEQGAEKGAAGVPDAEAEPAAAAGDGLDSGSADGSAASDSSSEAASLAEAEVIEVPFHSPKPYALSPATAPSTKPFLSTKL